MTAFSYRCPFCDYENWTEEGKIGSMRDCSKCKRPSIVPGTTKRQSAVSGVAKGSSVEIGGGKYPSLRAISGYFSLLAWLSLIASILMAAWIFTQGSLGIVGSFVVVITGIASYLINSAFGELIILAIDIEANTRKTT